MAILLIFSSLFLVTDELDTEDLLYFVMGHANFFIFGRATYWKIPIIVPPVPIYNVLYVE